MSKGPPAQVDKVSNKRKERERTDRDDDEKIEITLSDDNIEVFNLIYNQIKILILLYRFITLLILCVLKKIYFVVFTHMDLKSLQPSNRELLFQ